MLGGAPHPHPLIVTIRDNDDSIRGPLIFLLYHYHRVVGPPKLASVVCSLRVCLHLHNADPEKQAQGLLVSAFVTPTILLRNPE